MNRVIHLKATHVRRPVPVEARTEPPDEERHVDARAEPEVADQLAARVANFARRVERAITVRPWTAVALSGAVAALLGVALGRRPQKKR
jgi:ElaB/YqjD/DUF883 family membrane-anchored ribosome-binding protein